MLLSSVKCVDLYTQVIVMHAVLGLIAFDVVSQISAVFFADDPFKIAGPFG